MFNLVRHPSHLQGNHYTGIRVSFTRIYQYQFQLQGTINCQWTAFGRTMCHAYKYVLQNVPHQKAEPPPPYELLLREGHVLLIFSRGLSGLDAMTPSHQPKEHANRKLPGYTAVLEGYTSWTQSRARVLAGEEVMNVNWDESSTIKTDTLVLMFRLHIIILKYLVTSIYVPLSIGHSYS